MMIFATLIIYTWSLDRDREKTGISRVGGCLIAIKSVLSSMRMKQSVLNKEDMWISVVHEN